MHYLNFLRQLLETGRVVIESSELAGESAISDSAQFGMLDENGRLLIYQIPLSF